MSLDRPAPEPDAGGEIPALIETLIATEARLEALTAGEVDTVAGRDGRTFMLHRAQEQLRLSEAGRQTAILSALPANIALLDAQGTIVSVNAAWRSFAITNVLHAPGHGVGLNYLDICDQAQGEHSAEAHQVAAGIRSVMGGGADRFSIEYPCHSPTEQRWFLLTVTPLAEGRTDGVVVMHLNITERKRAEEASRRLASIVESSNDAILGETLEGIVTFWNRAAETIFGYTAAEMIGRSVAVLLPPDHATEERAILNRMVGSEETFHLETRRMRKDGVQIDVAATISPIRDSDGKIVGLSKIGRDITERKRSEQVIERGLQRLTEAQRIGQIGDWEWDLATQAITWSPQVFEIFGRDPRLGPPHNYEESTALFEAASQAVQTEGVARAIASGEAQDYELRAQRPNGEPVVVQGRANPRKDQNGKVVGLYGTVQDITKRKQAEAERNQLTRQMELLLASTDEGINGMDLEGSCTFINRAGAEMLGWKAEEVVGQHMHELVHHHRADGSPYPLAECPLFCAFRKGEGCRVDTEVFWRKDGTSFPVEYSSYPIREAGVITGAVVTFNDITEKKKLAAEFLRSQRMEGIGALAGGIAHDLNNALAPVLLSVEILKLTIKEPEKCRILDTIYDCAQRGANMVKQILTFARGSEGMRGIVQPRHLVQEMIDMTRHTFPAAIQIRTDVAPNIWTLLGNPTQLHQILLNLCVNARDAMPDGGALTLAANNVTLDATGVELSPEAKPGPYVVLTVKDTGTGMVPEVRARLFEAFFTTKAPGKGTGLGLTTVHSIAKEHSGFLTVDSEVGKGTTFKVYLPAQADAVAMVAAERLPLPLGKGELILVVDDEAAVCTIVSETLQAFGYRVVTASDGAQAVGVCAQHLADLQLLITDMAMPIMDGQASIRAIRSLLPRLKVIAASGSDSASDSPVLKELGVQAFLRKPYSADDLIRTVHEVLKGKV